MLTFEFYIQHSNEHCSTKENKGAVVTNYLTNYLKSIGLLESLFITVN